MWLETRMCTWGVGELGSKASWMLWVSFWLGLKSLLEIPFSKSLFLNTLLDSHLFVPFIALRNRGNHSRLEKELLDCIKWALKVFKMVKKLVVAKKSHHRGRLMSRLMPGGRLMGRPLWKIITEVNGIHGSVKLTKRPAEVDSWVDSCLGGRLIESTHRECQDSAGQDFQRASHLMCYESTHGSTHEFQSCISFNIQVQNQ